MIGPRCVACLLGLLPMGSLPRRDMDIAPCFLVGQFGLQHWPMISCLKFTLSTWLSLGLGSRLRTPLVKSVSLDIIGCTSRIQLQAARTACIGPVQIPEQGGRVFQRQSQPSPSRPSSLYPPRPLFHAVPALQGGLPVVAGLQASPYPKSYLTLGLRLLAQLGSWLFPLFDLRCWPCCLASLNTKIKYDTHFTGQGVGKHYLDLPCFKRVYSNTLEMKT